jgi:hypothetical protein
MKNLSFILLSAALIFSGCGKDDAKTTTCDLNAGNFVGSYKITSELFNGVEIHNTTNYDPCELDDLLIFNTNGTYNYSDAGTVCSPSGDDSGVWSLVGTNLIVDSTDMGTVSDFSCTGFKFTVQDSTDTFIVTFAKQ